MQKYVLNQLWNCLTWYLKMFICFYSWNTGWKFKALVLQMAESLFSEISIKILAISGYFGLFLKISIYCTFKTNSGSPKLIKKLEGLKSSKPNFVTAKISLISKCLFSKFKSFRKDSCISVVHDKLGSWMHKKEPNLDW